MIAEQKRRSRVNTELPFSLCAGVSISTISDAETRILSFMFMARVYRLSGKVSLELTKINPLSFYSTFKGKNTSESRHTHQAHSYSYFNKINFTGQHCTNADKHKHARTCTYLILICTFCCTSHFLTKRKLLFCPV